MAPKKKQPTQATKQKGKAVKMGKSSNKGAATKRQKGASSSAIQDSSSIAQAELPLMQAQQFFNDEALACFKRIVINKNMSQRSFLITPDHPAHEQMVMCKWTSFATTPSEANLMMVRELYANAKFCPEGHYKTQGVDVLITANIIR